MKIAVTGANGLLGQYLVKQLLENECTVIATGRGRSRLPFITSEKFTYYDADLTDKEAVQSMLLAEQPAILVHAGAMTQVDDCEQNRETCYEVNVRATSQLIETAALCSAFVLFVSTDFVFDGQKGNYNEEDRLKPLSWYGQTKLQGEEIVRSGNSPWAIVRTCLVYGNALTGTRSNIITWVKKNLEEGKEIKVVGDQVRTPTYVEDLAKGIISVIHKKAAGIYHISGKDVLTPFEMATCTAEYFNYNTDLIKKVDASIFTQPAKRPPKTGFDITKARRDLGYEPLSFEEGLHKMFSSAR